MHDLKGNTSIEWWWQFYRRHNCNWFCLRYPCDKTTNDNAGWSKEQFTFMAEELSFVQRGSCDDYLRFGCHGKDVSNEPTNHAPAQSMFDECSRRNEAGKRCPIENHGKWKRLWLCCPPYPSVSMVHTPPSCLNSFVELLLDCVSEASRTDRGFRAWVTCVITW